MTTSESKGRYFYKTNGFESIRITNRIDSNRELECSNVEGEVTSQNLWSRYDRHVVGIAWHDVWSQKAKIYGFIHIKLNQLVY